MSLGNAVKQSWLGAQPVNVRSGATDRRGVNYANHGHAFTPEDMNALLDFADKQLRGLPVERRFDEFPSVTTSDAVFNVRESGAVGDGKTKDTAAIQAALDRCVVVGSRTGAPPR